MKEFEEDWYKFPRNLEKIENIPKKEILKKWKSSRNFLKWKIQIRIIKKLKFWKISRKVKKLEKFKKIKKLNNSKKNEENWKLQKI